MMLLHTKFHCNNIISFQDSSEKTSFGRQVFGRGLGVVKVDKNGSEWIRVDQSTFEYIPTLADISLWNFL